MNIEGKPITDVLRELESGRFTEDVTAALYKIVNAVMRTKKAGSLKLTLDITPTGRSVMVTGKYTEKVPEDDRQATTFFVDDHGGLTRNDPQQQKLPFREVADHQAPLREVK
jgi:hypothetical protein